MAMVKIIESSDFRVPETDMTRIKFREFLGLKKQVDDLTKRQNVLKPELMEYTEEFGEEDDKGHLYVHFDPPVDGYSSMQRQRRVSFGYDEDAAKQILKDKGIYEDCIVMRPVIDEERIMGFLSDGTLTEEDIDAIRPQKITWAFVPVKV
jgi:hypothetical protein